jgi:hypothetical protein
VVRHLRLAWLGGEAAKTAAISGDILPRVLCNYMEEGNFKVTNLTFNYLCNLVVFLYF